MDCVLNCTMGDAAVHTAVWRFLDHPNDGPSGSPDRPGNLATASSIVHASAGLACEYGSRNDCVAPAIGRQAVRRSQRSRLDVANGVVHHARAMTAHLASLWSPNL
jgi:hypothetical protein